MRFVCVINRPALIENSEFLDDILKDVSTHTPRPSKTILPTGKFLDLILNQFFLTTTIYTDLFLADIMMYIYTSGTTGLPKPAIIKHDRYMGGGFSFFVGCGLTREDRVYVTLPL